MTPSLDSHDAVRINHDVVSTHLGYRNAMDVEDVLTHPEENVVAQLLTDEEIIESVIGINKDDIDEEDDESSTMEPPS
nr:hypothetical protein [Tanacetum cinerariifolium]